MHGILCFGDSITFGRGESPSVGWVGRLKVFFENKADHNAVYNLGIPGNTSNNLLDRFDAEAKARIRLSSEDQFVILISIGTNDSKLLGSDEKPNVSVEQFESNIKELLSKSHSNKAKLAFIGLVPVDETITADYNGNKYVNSRIEQFNNVIKEICELNNIPFLDLFDLMIRQDFRLLLDDGLHPNDEGYDFMFEEIKKFLVQKKLIT